MEERVLASGSGLSRRDSEAWRIPTWAQSVLLFSKMSQRTKHDFLLSLRGGRKTEP